MIQLAPILGWGWLSLILLLAAVAAGVSLFFGIHSARQRFVLGGLRLLALVVLAVILLQPQRRHEEVSLIRPQLAVLLDNSKSMTEVVDKAQPTRAERVKQWLASRERRSLEEEFELRLFSFDRALNELPADCKELPFDGESSNLQGSLGQMLDRFKGQPLAAALVFSDGLDPKAGPISRSGATGRVNAFELEQPFAVAAVPKRLTLGQVDFPARVVTGWDAEIRVGVEGSGLGGTTATVELWREGIKQSETPVSFNEDQQNRQVSFPVSHSEPGTVRYEVRLPAATQVYPFSIEVLEPGARILYVQNSLGFDFKFLRKAILAERNLKLNAFVRWADGRIVQLDRPDAAGASLDFSPEALAQNAVVMLGDLPAAALSPAYTKAIRDFVDRGGGLILLGGPNSFGSEGFSKTALGELIPVTLPAEYREGSFPVQITDTGLHHPVFGPLFSQVNDFPPLLTANEARSVAPTAEVLLQTGINGKPCPIIVSTRFGKGRVVVVLSDTLWRWRLASKGWAAERSPYDTFWAQLMDWMLPKEPEKPRSGRIELFTERSSYEVGERPEVCAIIQQSGAAPKTLPVQVRTPDGKVFDYALRPGTLRTKDGREVAGYRAEVEPNVTGLFRVTSSLTLDGTTLEGEARFVVNRPATELTGQPIARQQLQAMAESGGGRFYALGEWEKWRGDLHYEQQQFSRLKITDLWNQPLIPALLMAFLALDWLTRKRWNLP